MVLILELSNDIDHLIYYIELSFKRKLAHNFMISYLVLISSLSDMVRTFKVDKNAKIDFIHIYREKKI